MFLDHIVYRPMYQGKRNCSTTRETEIRDSPTSSIALSRRAIQSPRVKGGTMTLIDVIRIRIPIKVRQCSGTLSSRIGKLRNVCQLLSSD